MIESQNQLQSKNFENLVLRVAPMPNDANQHGDIFGGWIMAQVDIAGSIPATRYAKGKVVTLAVNSFLFKQPVKIGDLLSFYAEIIKVGNTSITVHVTVFAERNPENPEYVKVTEADLVYIAIDKATGKPKSLQQIVNSL